ncbi:hypothetical protein nbrc107697_02160 [Gordonia crocea]|uniref:Pullulanase n=1 Tax=Gordonia crocea TaxID=589162 RepID=A0A7M3SU53_9ACTN|nr:hypothetical protein nbrc107697_02160 [Gordonia crocea]
MEPFGAALRPRIMDPPLIAHSFGTGAGPTHTWYAPADADLNGDGRAESVSLDFDGDGLADDAMIDSDGDGVADLVGLDLDDDGVPETFYSDDGSGVWGVRTASPFARAPSTSSGQPPTGPPRPGRQPVDTDGDGKADATLVTRGSSRELRLDTDGDGQWDLALVDDDGDGVVDRVARRDP